MPLILINRKEVPKDGFWVTDPTSGRRFGGYYSFAYVSQQLLAYRLGNSLPGATKPETDALLDLQTCNANPSLCFDPGSRVPESQTRSGGCSSCGGITIT